MTRIIRANTVSQIYASTSLLQVVVVDFAFQSCNDELVCGRIHPTSRVAEGGGRHIPPTTWECS
jgi:hypothetical protein